MNSKVFKKVCNIFLDILIGIFSVFLVVIVYNDVQVKMFQKGYAEFFGYSTFEVQTGSMAPTINANDLIIVKKEKDPKLNDIITYQKGKDYITHRVVESYKETFVTKGDANNAKDEAIKKEQIVGKVVKIIPNFGAFKKTILNPFVLITLIVTIYIISRLFSSKESFVTRTIANIKNSRKENKEIEKMEEELEKKTSKETPEETPEAVPVEDKAIEEQAGEIEVEDPNSEEDLEKTIFFRKISVDSSELKQDTPVIIGTVEEEKEEEPIHIEEVEIREDEEQARLKTLKKRYKRFNNIVEKAMSLKEQEINEILPILDSSKLRPNEASIKNSLIKIYIDAKYYNHCGEIIIDYNAKNMCSKLENVMKTETLRMIKDYDGNDTNYEAKVLKFRTLFMAIIHIEHIDATIEDMDTKAAAYKKKLSQYLKNDSDVLNAKIKEIINIQRVYKKILNDTLNNVETTLFELHYNPLSTNKNIYGLVLDHNISFSKVYSNYIISKTYDEGVVAEDKILVLLNMLLNKIAQDMIAGNFKNKYLLYLPTTLYKKKTKLNKILNVLEDEFVKNSVLILVKSSVIVNNKKTFKDMKKQGYQIAIIYDNTSTKDSNNPIYSIATYLFVDKKVGKGIKFDHLDPKAIVYENITTKVDIPRGEE